MGVNGRIVAWAAGILLAAPALAEPPPGPRPAPAGERLFVHDRDEAREARRERKLHHQRLYPALSPEERRQLRRDIHEAGRDLYHRDLPRKDGRREAD